jgi:MFS family permease
MRPPRFIFVASFLCSIHVALLSYLNSTMLQTAVGSRGVTLAYVCASALTIIGIAISPIVVRKIGARSFLRLVLAIVAILLATLSAASGFHAAVLFTIYFAITTVIWYAFDLVLEHFCREDMIGNIRGFYLALNNLAWVLSPIIGSRIVTLTGIRMPYAIAAVLVAIAALCVYAIPKFRNSKHLPRAKLSEAFAALKARPVVRKVVALYFLLQFFFAWMVIHLVPHLTGAGFSWKSIGIILSAMLLPFVLVQYPIGKLVDRYHVEKTMLGIGFFIAGVFTLALALPIPQTVIMYAVILFGTRVGAAIAEVAAESAFFKRVKEDDTALVGMLRMMFPLAYIIAPLLAALILSIGSIQTLFGVLAILLFIGGVYAFRIQMEQPIDTPQ